MMAAENAALSSTKEDASQAPHRQENHFIPGTVIYGGTFGADEARRLGKDNVVIGNDSRGNYICLTYGNILLVPDKDMKVGTSSGCVNVSLGASVFVMQSDKGLVVYDLSQKGTQQVMVVPNDKHNKRNKIMMRPGNMVVLSSQNKKDFAELELDCHLIPYKNVRQLDWCDGSIKAYLADFSIQSALFTIQPLKQLATSSNGEDKLALQKLLQDANLAKNIAATTDSANTDKNEQEKEKVVKKDDNLR